MPARCEKDGLKGITTASTYDAWTPARAYSHYHAGARILSETASARLASPIEIKPEQLRSRRGFDVNKESDTYGPLWKGGKWTMRDITNYMTTAAYHLLDHASDNREKWLTRFHKIGHDATRPRKEGELNGYIVEYGWNVIPTLKMAGVEVEQVGKFEYEGTPMLPGSHIVRLDQPYGSFAKAMLGKVKYPNLLDKAGNPVPPYDVTAHDLGLLTGARVFEIRKSINPPKFKSNAVATLLGRRVGYEKRSNNYCLYRSAQPSKDEGWTRWVADEYGYYLSRFDLQARTDTTHSFVSCNASMVKKGPAFGTSEKTETKAIIFPDQSPDQILNGYPKDSMPEEYVGGIGKEGVAKLEKFVRDGGTLVFLNRSSVFAIEHFNLPIKDIAKNWKRSEFFIPGSILRIDTDGRHAISKGDSKSIAWFERSPVFELGRVTEDGTFARVVAKYPENPDDILLAGWALGKEKIAGKAAIVEVRMGNGKIVLFGFRPQYRGQSTATFDLLFNAISY